MGTLSFRLRALGETSSTNDEVKRAIAAGEPEGLAVRAARQTGGYGRQGRTWASPEGGLYLSLLLRPQVPPDMLPTLSLAVGVAVRRALASLVPPDVADAIQLKWPNDIVVAGVGIAAAGEPAAPPFGKLCGISLEAQEGSVCAGIGVNVVRPASAPAVDGKNVPVYLAELAAAAEGVPAVVPASARQPACVAHPASAAPLASVLSPAASLAAAAPAALAAVAPASLAATAPAALDPATVCDAVLAHLSQVYGAWCAHGLAPLLDEYNRHAALVGRQVSVENRAGGLLAQGVACGVDTHGCLVLADGLGAEVAVSSGEAHLAFVS